VRRRRRGWARATPARECAIRSGGQQSKKERCGATRAGARASPPAHADAPPPPLCRNRSTASGRGSVGPVASEEQGPPGRRHRGGVQHGMRREAGIPTHTPRPGTFARGPRGRAPSPEAGALRVRRAHGLPPGETRAWTGSGTSVWGSAQHSPLLASRATLPTRVRSRPSTPRTPTIAPIAPAVCSRSGCADAQRVVRTSEGSTSHLHHPHLLLHRRARLAYRPAHTQPHARTRAAVASRQRTG
jgi:hypothetical protein